MGAPSLDISGCNPPGPFAAALCSPFTGHALPSISTADLRVLVVEDNAMLMRALRAMLSRLGGHVREASSVAQAARHLESFKPDVLLLDDRLPDGRSLDVMQALWRCQGIQPGMARGGTEPPNGSRQAVVVMSIPNGSDLDDAYVAALSGAGAKVEVVNKPLNMAALQTVLTECMTAFNDRHLAFGLRFNDTTDDGPGDAPRPHQSIRHSQAQRHTDDSFWIDGDWGFER
jgi:CheY-like chemotaxis protein